MNPLTTPRKFKISPQKKALTINYNKYNVEFLLI